MNKITSTIKDIKVSDIIAKSINLPGAKIDRANYLTKEFRKYYPENTISEAIEKNPAQAGIPRAFINSIADNAIKYESKKVTAISTVSGMPGGIAMVATIPADITQYFVFILRILQKLAYLYGYPSIEINEDSVDDTAMTELLTFTGIMFGVREASIGLKVLTQAMSQNLPKKIARQALTKTAYYPIVKKIAQKIGIKMTKELFSKSVGKIIPIIGGALNGSLTYLTFKPCAVRLKNELQNGNLSDPDFYNNIDNDE